MSGAREESLLNSSLLNSSFGCGSNMSSWEQRMDKMYTYFYLLLFIPGLLLNTTALWVLCRHISKKSKAVIFMINLALADLAHILSLPLRIYYYFTHTWPFGRGVCLFCFYLKYLNMYAAIVFLVCISAQRCIFLLHPFCARRWRRRYDLAISVIVWGVVSLACSPFILMRSSSSSTSPGGQHPPGHAQLYAPHSSASPGTVSGPGCFKDLPMRHVTVSLAITMMVLAELFGFIIPLACISYSSIRIARSLGPTRGRNEPDSSTRSRLQSVSSSCPKDRLPERQTNAEKRRALRMVLSCSALFLICFAPYHINFLLYLMVSQNIVSHCATNLAVRQFHPVSLCLASLSCCLNPLLYYFLNAEFRLHLTRRTSSFSGALLSSPISSPTQRPEPAKLMSKESTCSDREDCGWSPEGLYSTGAFVFPPTNDTNVSVRQTEKTTEQISSGTARRPQTDSEEL